MAIYEVFGEKDIGSKILSLERVYGAKNAIDAITKIIAHYATSKDNGKVLITKIRVWGTSNRKGTSEFDPTKFCDCHSSPLWKCPKILPETVSISSDGIRFTVGE